MKKQRIFTLIAMGLVALLLTAGLVAAKAVRTEFSGVRYLVPDVNPIEPGTQWNSDEVAHMRDRLTAWRVETNDPRVFGTKYFVVNFNLQLPEKTGLCLAKGPMWGTFTLVPDLYCTEWDEDICVDWTGAWEGTYTGYWDGEGYAYQNYVGHGTGELEGLQIRAFTEVRDPDCPPPPPPQKTWDFTGHILDPHGE